MAFRENCGILGEKRGGMEHAVIAHGPGEPGGAGGVRPGGGPAFRLPPWKAVLPYSARRPVILPHVWACAGQYARHMTLSHREKGTGQSFRLPRAAIWGRFAGICFAREEITC